VITMIMTMTVITMIMTMTVITMIMTMTVIMTTTQATTTVARILTSSPTRLAWRLPSMASLRS
jgi:hypothetical protein